MVTQVSTKASKKKWGIYLALTVLAGGLGSIGPLITEWLGKSLSLNEALSIHMVFIFLFLALMFSLIINIWYEEKEEERNWPIDVVVGQRDIMSVCKSLREGEGACEMKAVWCSQYPGVARYFKEELDDFGNNKELSVKRLINRNIVKNLDYKKHLSSTLNLRNSGRYEVKTTDLCEMECTVCAYVVGGEKKWKAFLIVNNIQNHVPVLGILFDPAKKPECETSLQAIISWFDKEWEKGGTHV